MSPATPCEQDATQGQFFSGFEKVWIQSFLSPRSVAIAKLKNHFRPTIYPKLERKFLD